MDDEPKVTELMVGRHVVGLMTNCYIVGNRDTREAICIDPCAYMRRQTDEVAHLAADLGVKITFVIATHGHHDHVVGVGAMKERIGAPFLIHRSDLSILKGGSHQSSSSVW